MVSSDNVLAHLDLGDNDIKFLLKDDVSGLRVFSLRQILTQVPSRFFLTSKVVKVLIVTV